jgi:enolase-phosphatase E1
MDAALHRERRGREVPAPVLRSIVHPADARRAHDHDLTISLAARGVTVVLLDIEGTTTPITFVHDVLFPYARAHLREHTTADVAVRMEALMDVDAKDGELKELQGRIWERGYAEGELRGAVYPDVRDAFARWSATNVRVAIYSSGSVQAQRLLFANSEHGDLTRFIANYFDTGTGPKKVAESYRRIARSLGAPPLQILFVSDVHAELSAAREAGMQTVLSLRPGNPEEAVKGEETISSFDELTA